MANLLDTIRQNQNVLTQQPGVTDQTAQIQGLMRAKSGKAVGGSGIAASNLGEQQAVQQTGQQLGQVQQQANIAQQGLQQQQQGIQQQQQAQEQSVAQGRQMDTLQTRVQTDQILSDLERNKGQVDLQKQQAQVDQAAFNLRMQSQQYVDNLQLEGNKARLTDQLSFQKNLAQATFGDNEDLLKQKLGNQDVLAANNRDFENAMSSIDANFAWQIFGNNMQSDQQRTQWEAIGSLVTAGAGAASIKPTPNSQTGVTSTTEGVDSAGSYGEGTAVS